MWKGNRKLKPCGRIMSIVILMSFLMPFRGYGEPPTEQPLILNENETKRYSDYEIDILIDDLTEAAIEAIERAAVEAAKATALASIERESVLLQEKAAAMREAQRWRNEAETAKKDMKKIGFYTMVIGLIGGMAFGIGATYLIGGRY